MGEQDKTKAGFQVGNQLWKARSKHGRNEIFDSPQTMWEAAAEYFDFVDANPWYDYDVKVIDKELQEISLPKKVPYTIVGLSLFCHVNQKYFHNFESRMNGIIENPEASDADKKRAEDFITVIDAIKDTCYKQKFEGASNGFFNATIISRELGLADKKQIEGNLYLGDKPIEFE